MKYFLFLFSILCNGQGILGPILGTPAPVTSCSLSYVTNLKGWFKADAGVTCTSGCSDGNAVTSWADQSGNTNNLTFGSSGVYKTAQLNGKPVIRFDGSATYATFGTAINLQNPTDSTIFIVAKATAIASQANTILSGPSGSFTYRWGMTNQGLDWTFVAVEATGSNPITTTSFHQANVNRLSLSTSTIAFRLDRSPDGSTDSFFAVNSNEITVGKNGQDGSSPFGGDIAELLIYSESVSGGNTTTVENYLNCKYGI